MSRASFQELNRGLVILVFSFPICAKPKSAAAEEPTLPAVSSPEVSAEKHPGACSVADRAEHIHESNPAFISDVRTCSRATWANKEKDVACLVKARPSLSQSC